MVELEEVKLRTVPTNGKYFFPDNDYEIISGAIEIQKENWG